MTLGKSKLTHIVTNVVCRQETHRISTILRGNKFSVYEDETSDVTNDKWLSLMVRYVEPKTIQTRCELLQMIHLNAKDCSANKIFEAFKNELLKKNISLQLLVGLACDNASVMVGKNSSFKTRLIKENPDLVTLPCVCHSSALAAKQACEVIPKDCERFLTGISTFINNSPKRKAVFQEINMTFENSSLTILKYAETRWLTRHKCIQRILEIWDILGHFLMEQTSDNNHSANNLFSIYENPATKAYFLFLDFTLNIFNQYNAKFQGQRTVIHELQPSSIKLLLWFFGKFIKPDLLKPEIFSHNMRILNFSDGVNQLPLEEMDFGFECKQYLQDCLLFQKMSEIDIDLVRENCLRFYIKASEQIRDQLPVDDTFLHCVAVFDKKSALFDCDRDSTFRKILYVNRILSGVADEILIQGEWKLLYEINTVKKDEWSNLSFDDMWIQISFFATEEGKLYFPNLRLLLNVVRTLPHSNAEAERAFSVVTDTKTRKKIICLLRL